MATSYSGPTPITDPGGSPNATLGLYNEAPSWSGAIRGAGSVPAPVSYPNPAANLAAVYPNLSASTGQASADVMSELQGQLSPETLANLQRASAQWGVGAGIPGSGAQIQKNLLSNVQTTQQLQQQGLGDFLRTTQGVSNTQTLPPSLQYEIADRNAAYAAAPDPNQTAKELTGLAGGGGLTARPFLPGQGGGNNALAQPSVQSYGPGGTPIGAGPAYAGNPAIPDYGNLSFNPTNTSGAFDDLLGLDLPTDTSQTTSDANDFMTNLGLDDSQ